MCGFVVVAGSALPPREIVDLMRDTLAHRGPDDASTEAIDDWVIFGHRRLSIIDVEGARQPLRSEDGGIVCVFNGEIYNFVSLRERLLALGHVFATSGDGEVVVHGYEQWGRKIFELLEGMFSIALVDRRAGKLFLARDRIGIKPLYYAHLDRGVVAASEIKALLPLTKSNVACAEGLSLGTLRMHVPWPLTAFDGVFRLPPGALLEVDRTSRMVLSRFATQAHTPTRSATVEEALERLRRAVARQMVADVPVGAFLSGGIDSTLIVALMREISNGEIHTFTIRTVDQDESADASLSAREIGTTHHDVALETMTFEDLVELPSIYDEPFAETSALGVRALSKFARNYVKVALSGDGGDEVFGGYSSYRWIKSASVLRATQPLGPHVQRLLRSRAWSEPVRRALRLGLLVASSPATAQRDLSTLSWAASKRERDASERLSHAIATAIHPDIEPDAVRAAMLADRLERLPNAMLTKVDAASMSASLEVRVPLLDDELVRFADRLPVAQMLNHRFGKLLLRRVIERTRGKRVAWATKRGFTLPLDRWMLQPANRVRFGELFGDYRATLDELTGEDVHGLWNQFCTGGARFSRGTGAMQLLWFANVALWSQRFGVKSVRVTSRMPIA